MLWCIAQKIDFGVRGETVLIYTPCFAGPATRYTAKTKAFSALREAPIKVDAAAQRSQCILCQGPRERKKVRVTVEVSTSGANKLLEECGSALVTWLLFKVLWNTFYIVS